MIQLLIKCRRCRRAAADDAAARGRAVHAAAAAAAAMNTLPSFIGTAAVAVLLVQARPSSGLH